MNRPLASPFSSRGPIEDGPKFVGRWRLSQWRSVELDGTGVHYPFGEHPVGSLVYTAGGWMMVQVVTTDRPMVSIPDPVGGPVEERAAAYSTCVAYCGPYEVRGDQVIHHVEMSLFPNWVGQDQMRYWRLAGDMLILRTPPIQIGGKSVVSELHWTREEF